MSEQPVDHERFDLSGGSPVRSLAIASGATTLGALIVVGSVALDLPVALLVVGAVFMVAGVLLGIAGVVLVRRLATTVTTDDTGLTISRARGRRTIDWASITDVRSAGPRLTLALREAEPVTLVSLRGAADPTYRRLLVTLQQRLDADRGYREFN